MTPRSETELAFLSVEQAARFLRRRKISPVDLVRASLARIERFNSSLNPFLTILSERALRQARLAEREIHRRGPKSPLHGIPVSLKDNFYTRGVRTTAGAKILVNFVPDQDSEVAARLAGAGAILLGKTNMHEFAYGITSENPHFGPVRNPWDRTRISGGSSGGSAVAVATGMGLASVGTDTGGSIRIPSALSGVVGLKPTFGLVSVAGVVPLVPSLDHAGPLARGVVDACIVLEAVAGQYPKGTARPNFRKLRANRPRKFRLGWPLQYYFDRVDDDVKRVIDAAAKQFESLGARISKVSLPHLARSPEPSTNMAMAEATWYHESQGYFPARAADYGEDVRGRLEAGDRVRAVDYLRAFDAKRTLERDFSAAFERVDAILAPAAPIPAPHIGEQEVLIGGKMENVRSLLVGTSRPANFTGLPAISLPCGFSRGGLPVGLQLIGPRWGEARLLAIALAYEEAAEWQQKHPELH